MKSARPALLLLVVALTSCGAYHPGQFRNAAPVWEADDQRPSAMPTPRRDLEPLYVAEAYQRDLIKALEVGPVPLAGDVNAWDEVVSSSWFRGVRRPTLNGYRRHGPPHRPLEVIADEVHPPRFDEDAMVVRDRRGVHYELVRDLPGCARHARASWVVASRIAFALGYNVPEAWASRAPSGERVVALAHGEGVDLGPTPMWWPRLDDENDTVDHLDRRSLRATKLVGAWLGMRDFDEHAFRDRYVGERGRGYTVHEWVGLGTAIGSGACGDEVDDEGLVGHSATWRWLTLGHYGGDEPALAEGRPAWPHFPSYLVFERYLLKPPFPPHERLRPDDAFWMAKRIADVGAHLLATAIEHADLEAAESEAIALALNRRRRTILNVAYTAVTPLDVVRVSEAGEVTATFRDRQREVAGLERRTGYHVAVLERDGTVLLRDVVRAKSARWAFTVPRELTAPRRHLVVRVWAATSEAARSRSVDVHLARRDGRYRLVGVEH